MPRFKAFKILLSISLFLLIVLIISHFTLGSPFSFPFLDWFFSQDFAGTEMTREDAYGLNLTTGMEVVARVGDKFEGENKEKGWMDGQIVDIRPLGFYTGRFARQHFAVIELPNINYWDLRNSKDWKSTATSTKELKKYLESENRKRDYFIDFRWLLDKGYITKDQYFDIYDRNKTHDQISLDFTNIEQLFSHEDKKERLARLEDRRTWTLVKKTISRFIPIAQAQPISSGTFSIGAGLDYDTVTLFEADIAAQLTGNLTGEHADEETSISSVVTFDTDTNGFLLKLTAASGAEHNGGTYGNGARINFTTYDGIKFDETNDGDMDDIEISKLAIDNSGIGNSGIQLLDGAVNGNCLVNRLLIKSDTNDEWALRSYREMVHLTVRNCIVYGSTLGIRISHYYGNATTHYYNNTVIKCTTGIKQDETGLSGSLTVKNNLVQGCTNDFVDDGGGFGTHAYNISEDATSPDAAYRNKEVAFADEANDDFHLAASDTEAKNAGENLYTEGGFSDDIDGDTRPASNWDIGADEAETPVEFVSTIMEGTVGDYHSLSEWESAIDCDLTASSTRVYSFDANSGWISDGASVSTDSGASTATLLHMASSSQALLIDIQGSFDDNDVVTDGTNNFTLSNNGAPAIATAKIDGAWTNPDTTAVTIDGWTTSAANYIRIYTTDAARHDGKWDTGKYRLEVSAQNGIINIYEDYVRVEGLQFLVKAGWSNDKRGIYLRVDSGSSERRISHNIFTFLAQGSNSNHQAIYAAGGTNKIYNNIIYDFDSGTAMTGWISSNTYIYNNTIHNCSYGFDDNGNFVLKNNIVQDCTTGFSGTFDNSSTNNLSDDSTYASSTADIINTEVSFVDEANDDFHLAGSDTAARDAGTDLSGDSNLAFNDDIDGEGRGAGGAWDIGADEKKKSAVINAPLTNKLTDGLVGYWTFDGQDMDWASTTAEALDRSGNSNNGDVTNFDHTSVTRGISGQALEFDGVDDYVDCGTDSSLNFGVSDLWTFSTWMYPISAPYPNYFRYAFAGPPGLGGAFLAIENLDHRFVYREGSGDYTMHYFSIDSALDIFDKWTYLAFVADGNGNISLYKNGLYIETITGLPRTDFRPYRLGKGYDTSPLKGSLDEVRIYNRALSADEVMELYQAGARRLKANVSQVNKLTDGLVGYWSFDGQDMDWASTTAEALDRSGNSNNGDVRNGAKVARGISGQALGFDGVDDYVETSITMGDFASSGFSISGWFYGTAFDATNYVANPVTSEIRGSTTDRIAMGVDGGNFAILIYTNKRILITGSTLSPGKWYHGVYTYDGTNIRGYLNGILDIGPFSETLGSTSGSTTKIGKSALAAAKYFNGTIDEVRIYNRALSADEVMELYRAGAKRMKLK